VRHLKVTERSVCLPPMLKLAGQWLVDAGFIPGQRVEVAITGEGEIIIRRQQPTSIEQDRLAHGSHGPNRWSHAGHSKRGGGHQRVKLLEAQDSRSHQTATRHGKPLEKIASYFFARRCFNVPALAAWQDYVIGYRGKRYPSISPLWHSRGCARFIRRGDL
jgi:hypothetical protein